MNTPLSSTRRYSWIIPGPGPDESLRSVIGRASRVHGVPAEALWESVRSAAPFESPDNPASGTVLRIAKAIGTSPADLMMHRLSDSPEMLCAASRLAYCARCWAEDDEAGRPRSFRREWSYVLRTMCPVHSFPLQLPRNQTPEREQLDADQVRSSAGPSLELIDEFGRVLEASLFHGKPWPANWRGNPLIARAWVLCAVLNLSPDDRFPIACEALVPRELNRYLHRPVHTLAPPRHGPWDALRLMADPALRRTGLWVACARCRPDFPIRCHPWPRFRGRLPGENMLSTRRAVRALVSQATHN